MNRDQAGKIISGLFDEAVDDVDTERLKAMKRELLAQMKVIGQRGLHQKVVDALDAEISARGQETEGEAVEVHISPQTPAETETAGYPGDEPGEMRHGVEREASAKWRVVGR